MISETFRVRAAESMEQRSSNIMNQIFVTDGSIFKLVPRSCIVDHEKLPDLKIHWLRRRTLNQLHPS